VTLLGKVDFIFLYHSALILMRMGGWNANVLMLPVRIYVIFWANIFLETIQIRSQANPQTERWCWGLCQMVVRHLALVRLYPSTQCLIHFPPKCIEPQ
jgi:hypothetical protein